MANYCENFNSTRQRTTNHKQNRERCPKTHVHDVPRHRIRVAKGIRTPVLTRKNAGSTVVSFRLVPIQSRTLPAVLFSGLDGVKSESPRPSAYRTQTRSGGDGTPCRGPTAPGALMLIARKALSLRARTLSQLLDQTAYPLASAVEALRTTDRHLGAIHQQ